eukprot:COSAG06_NODE_3829_length_4860_cov_9.798750_4_plen_311_part_00
MSMQAVKIEGVSADVTVPTCFRGAVAFGDWWLKGVERPARLSHRGAFYATSAAGPLIIDAQLPPNQRTCRTVKELRERWQQVGRGRGGIEHLFPEGGDTQIYFRLRPEAGKVSAVLGQQDIERACSILRNNDQSRAMANCVHLTEDLLTLFLGRTSIEELTPSSEAPTSTDDFDVQLESRLRVEAAYQRAGTTVAVGSVRTVVDVEQQVIRWPGDEEQPLDPGAPADDERLESCRADDFTARIKACLDGKIKVERHRTSPQQQGESMSEDNDDGPSHNKRQRNDAMFATLDISAEVGNPAKRKRIVDELP